MRYALLILTGFLLAASFVRVPRSAAAVSIQAAAPAKYALLVGVSNYDRGSKKPDFDWWNLNVKGDIEIMAETLIRKFAFKPENIKIICDEPVTVGGGIIPATRPTRAAIVAAFRSALTDKAGPGDVVYFHFSGHGQSVPDDNGDEADGMDETIIPADYVSQKDAANNLRDDEIGKLLSELSRKKPANVTIAFDSCFSGTATRGDELPRGGPWKGAPVGAKSRGSLDDSMADFVSRGNGSAGDVQQHYVFLSAASPRETAKETTQDGKKYGAFTYALAQALDRSGPSTTYRDLIESVTDAITRTQRQQTPQIEGEQEDKLVLANGALPSQPYLPVRMIRDKLYLMAGHLQGVTKGSKFALYPSGAKAHQPGTQIADAVVESVSPTDAAISLVRPADQQLLKTVARAFEISHVYDEVLRVAVRPDAVRGWELDDVFDDLTLAERVGESDNWDILIRPPDAKVGSEFVEKRVPAGFRGLVLQRRDGSVVAAIENELPDKTAAIKEALKREATWVLIKSFDDNTDPTLNVVKLRLVPVDAAIGPSGALSAITDSGRQLPYVNGQLQFRPCELDPETRRCIPRTGDELQLEITNTGPRDVYVTVLNLQSDGGIGPAFPGPTNTDNRIRAGSTFRVPTLIRMREPYGQESFRAIVTATPTDFTPLIDPALARGGDSGSNAAFSPLGKMLEAGSRGKRGTEAADLPPSWATANVVYYVKPPQK